jgi:hypothetical protein
MIDTEIVDTTLWPCFTPGLHWALSDEVRKIGSLSSVDCDAAEYEINVEELPDGEEGLWRFNALRNISVGLCLWPSFLSKQVTGATLCLGSKALQSVCKNEDDDIVFNMFSGDSILPLFVVDDSVLTLRIQFRQDPRDLNLPQYAGLAQGLLCKFKNRKKPFFVAGSSDSVLSWDGFQSHIFQTASMASGLASTLASRSSVLTETQKRVVDNENSTFSDLINSLSMSPIAEPIAEPRPYFSDFSLKTPRPE